jgi:cullin 3
LTGIPDADLGRTLQSLACGKYRLLAKTPKGREVAPSDAFGFNEAFTCPLARIRIMQVAAARVETGKEREETEGMVEEERRFQVEVGPTFLRALGLCV